MTAGRTGVGWDVVAVLAIVAPLAGVSVSALGARLRWSPATIAVAGGLAATALWTVLLAATAAPTVGRLDPAGPAMAAAAGTSLLAAVVAASGRRVEQLAAGPVATVLAGATTIIDAPTSLGRAGASALVVTGAVTAAGALAARRVVPIAVIAVPTAVLIVLWGADLLPDPPVALAVALAVAAAGSAWVALPPAASIALAAAAVAVAPIGAVRPAGALLAAAAVLGAAEPARPAVVLAALPGVAVAAAGLADLPVPGGPSGTEHALLAVALGAAVAGVAVSATRRTAGAASLESVDIAVGVLAAWLVLLPGSWRWAVPDSEVLAAWDRATAMAAAVGLLVVVGAVAGAGDRLRRPLRQ